MNKIIVMITKNAKEKLIALLEEENSVFVRFGIKGGGCSGFSYFFGIEEQKEPDDLEVPLNEKYYLLVDSLSMMYLEGTEIDYKKDMMGESFIFNNPNQSGACGCGQSVSF
jgi:iron-sulfur cluster assembly accessory protein